jgi:hypothetical protein
MASVVIAGNTSGTVTLSAPDIAGSTTLTLPTTSGTIVTTAGGSTVPFALGSAASPSITFTGDTNTGIFSPGADSIGFAEGGAEIARFDSSGNFGIGTSSPAYPLTVGNNRQIGSLNTSGSAVTFAIVNGSNNLVFGDDSVNTNSLTVQSRGNMLFQVNTAERMRIDNTGNVGIGITPSPWSTSNSTKAIQISSRGSIWANVNSTSINNNWYLASGDVNTYINTAAATRYVQDATGIHQWFYAPSGTAGATMTLTEAMRIGSTGNVVIGGTVSPNSVSTRGNLTINGANDAILNLNDGNNATEGAYVYFSGTNLELKTGRTSSTVRVIALTNGVVLNNGATSWSAISDERTKDIIEPITDATNKVSTLRAVIGKYKTDEEGTRRSFLIAQDVQAVLPEAVVPQDDEMGTLSLSYTDTIPLLVSAIQEQQAIINEQASTIAAFEARLVALENK